jgi:hypothetical protein
MEPDFFAHEFPLAGKKARAPREPRSLTVQIGWLFVVALIGFSATIGALRFGPDLVEYCRDLASRSSEIAPKPARRTVPQFDPVWVPQRPVVIQPPSIPQFNRPQGSGFAPPFPGGGFNSGRSNLHR